jgi:hypothetical protein
VETTQATGNTDTILGVLSSRQTYWHRRGTSHGQVTVRPSMAPAWAADGAQVSGPQSPPSSHSPAAPPHRSHSHVHAREQDRSNDCKRDLLQRPKRPTNDRTAMDHGGGALCRQKPGGAGDSMRDTIVIACVIPPSPLRQGMQHRAPGVELGYNSALELSSCDTTAPNPFSSRMHPLSLCSTAETSRNERPNTRRWSSKVAHGTSTGVTMGSCACQ